MTSFSTIYESNSLIRNTPSFSSLDAFHLSKVLFGFLKYAISYFQYDCKKNLYDKIDPKFDEYIIDCDGIETEFVLPTTPGSTENVNVWINSTLVTNYEYFPVTKKIVFSTKPEEGSKLVAQFYSCGHFNEDLDLREINILSEGMIVPYLSRYQNDENVMKYLVSGSSLKFFSQANHIATAKASVSHQYQDVVKELISEYSYKSRDDFSSLVG
jgi:hypothetical protein